MSVSVSKVFNKPTDRKESMLSFQTCDKTLGKKRLYWEFLYLLV